MHGDGGDSWRRCGRSYVGTTTHGGFSWPPRSYSCSFCRREFRSAQALGGHMNVHRRDRARLRQSPPWDNSPPPSSSSSNPNPNTNPAVANNVVPNLNMPPPLLQPLDGKRPPVLYSFRSLLCPDHLEGLGLKAMHGVGETDGVDRTVIMKKEERNPVVRLRLDLAAGCGEFEDSLDLELRLGYP